MTLAVANPTLRSRQEELFYPDGLDARQKSSPPHSRSEFLCGLLEADIYAAVSWQELDTCVSRARKAHEQGRLNSSQVESLMEHAILVSRYVPED